MERERGWRTRLPPRWPGFDTRTWRHMWVEFVVGSPPYSEGFSPGPQVFSQAVRFFSRSSVFPPSTKPTYQISNSTWKQWTREPPRGMPTAYFPLISHWMSVIIFNYFTKHVIEVDENPKTSIKLLVCYGVGVWVSVWKQPSIKLFHSETLKHVQDISIASPVTNMQRG